MKKKNPLLRILAGLVGGILGYALVSSMYEAGRNKSRLDAQLVQTADEMNRKLSIQSDPEIRLKKVTAGPGAKMTYDYTVLTKSKNDVNVLEFQKNARQFILDRYKTNVLFKLNVKLDCQYRDTNGDLIAEIIVTPNDF